MAMQSDRLKPVETAPKQGHKPVRRRRLPLSCDPCRTRKLRCNREQPCQNCAARNERAICKYKGSENGVVHTSNPGHLHPMQQRLEHLEGLVKRLVNQQHEIQPTEATFNQASPSSETCHTGVTLIDGVHSVFRNADEWSDVLEDINQLKDAWTQSQDDPPEYDIHMIPLDMVDGSSLLFGQATQIDMLEILESLPPKPEADKLIHQFFDAERFPITVAPILHQPTFMCEYAQHWKDPSQTSIIWLGLLFSILGITMLSYHQYGEPQSYRGISESLFQLYRQRTAQCLIIGDMAKCLPYTIETLRLNATAELNRKDDNRRGLWMLTGVIVRAAINMGYHRDPSHSPSISTLQAEYRRRTWLAVASTDDLASFLLGFPRMMPAIYSDTMEPRNLHDWEMSGDVSVLPPSRPLTESTPVTYLIIKGRLLRALGRITDLKNGSHSESYDAVLEIDKSLHDVYQEVPQQMRLHSGEASTISLRTKSDFSNLAIESMYHQGVITLHRRFIAKSRLDPRYSISRDKCVVSALAILDFQHLLEPSWYQVSRTRQLLSLAAMILFLELSHLRDSPDKERPSHGIDLQQALEKSCAFWHNAENSCEEASRIYLVLHNLLLKFQAVGQNIILPTQSQEPSLESPGSSLLSRVLEHNVSPDQDWFVMPNDMDIDWAEWDAFMEYAGI